MAETTYTVKAGDTLSKVASQYGVNINDISGYASGDPNKIGVGEQLKVMTRSTPPANVANATNLGQQQYNVPPVTPVTGYEGLIKGTNAVITDLAPTVDADKTEIKGKYDRLGQLPTERADGYEDEGVYDKQAIYRSAVNTINQKELAYQARIDKIRNENPTGQLSEGQQIQMDRLSKDWAIEKAGLSISAAFSKDDYELAKSIVDTRIDAETEGLKNELAGLQYFYTENFDRLSDERKNLLEFQIAQVEEEKAEKEQLYAEIGQVQLAAAESGAPASVITAIGKATDLTSAITAAGSYIGLLERQREARLGSEGGGSGTVDLAPEDERILTGAGFSVTDISDLKRSVAEFGIQATLDGIDDPAKKAAVRKVYNVGDVVNRASIEAAVTQKIAQDALKSNYTTDQLTEIARGQGFAKWYQGKDKERSNFLDSDKARQYYIDQLVEQYKAAGMYQE